MLLRSDFAAHQGIAKEYNLDIPNDKPAKNTFVFTEQDLPGFKSRSRQKFEVTTANMPARLMRVKAEKSKAPYDPNKKFTPFVRKSVPSKFISLIPQAELTPLNRAYSPCWKSSP